VTVRVQPISRLEFSANHTYFRDIPTFDPQLIGTGLLDKYLFRDSAAGCASRSSRKSPSIPTWAAVAAPATRGWH